MSDDIPVKSPSTYDLQIPGQEVIWTGVPRPEYSQEVGHRSHSFVFGLVPWKPLFFEMSCSIHVFVFSLQYFSFTLFTMALNEITQENASQISPTDSRLRPDIRLLEQGQIGNRKDKSC